MERLQNLKNQLWHLASEYDIAFGYDTNITILAIVLYSGNNGHTHSVQLVIPPVGKWDLQDRIIARIESILIDNGATRGDWYTEKYPSISLNADFEFN